MVDFKDDNGATTSRKAFLTFQVQVEKKDNKTLYDYLMRIRNTIPLETRKNHNNTRLFRIKEDLKERFKQVEMPQMFITQMTLRQTLNVLFQFVNSIVKIEYIKDNIDVLDVFEFNKIVGSFEMNDIVDFKTKQDVQQYGTEIVSWLENTIENDFRGNPNMTFPANNFFKTVRANNVQLTNNQNGFCLDLDGATLYDIHKFEVVLPKVTYGPVAPSQTYLAQTVENFKLDLTARLINKAEWELKRMTNDFPNYKQEGLWREKGWFTIKQGWQYILGKELKCYSIFINAWYLVSKDYYIHNNLRRFG